MFETQLYMIRIHRYLLLFFYQMILYFYVICIEIYHVSCCTSVTMFINCVVYGRTSCKTALGWWEILVKYVLIQKNDIGQFEWPQTTWPKERYSDITWATFTAYQITGHSAACPTVISGFHQRSALPDNFEGIHYAFYSKRSSIAESVSLYDVIMPSQIVKFMGPTWGPPGSYRPQMGPILAPWTLLSGYLCRWILR